jgi:hypothetical protein
VSVLADRVLLRGTALPPNAHVTAAAVSLTSREASEVTVEIVDPDLALLATGLLTKGATVDVDDLRMELAAFSAQPGAAATGALTLTCRPAAVRRLTERRGPLRMTGVSATDFVLAECAAVGVACVAQPGPGMPEVARDTEQPEDSSWSTFTRLATEVGYIVFEAAGTIFFGKPTWLMERSAGAAVPVGWFTANDAERARELPSVRTTLDGEIDTEVTAVLPGERARAVRPGGTLRLYGYPTFARDYLISQVSYDMLAGDVSVTAGIPRDPVPQPREATEGVGGDIAAAGGGGQGSASAFVDAALSQRGKPYVWGAEAASSNPDPRAYDCSELVEWAVKRVGGTIPDGSGNQINYCRSKGTEISVADAIRTRGALLWHTGHIAISLGNGKTIEAANRKVGVASLNAAGRFTRGGRVPGLRY